MSEGDTKSQRMRETETDCLSPSTHRQVSRSSPPFFVAIVGGSASGKSWLSQKLGGALDGKVARISLDAFYRDRSHLPPGRRARINFDHPASIDWAAFDRILSDCSEGRQTQVPCYDFKTHTRFDRSEELKPQDIILVDGLWLLRRPTIRRFFGMSIFLECSTRSRLGRRVRRDLRSRGRTGKSVEEQFWKTVEPMHKKFVLPQRRRADVVLRGKWGIREVRELARKLRSLARTNYG
jgi:uridine kinase